MPPPPWRPTPALARSLRDLFEEIEEESDAIRAQFAGKQDDLDVIRDSMVHIYHAASEAMRQIDDPGLAEENLLTRICYLCGEPVYLVSDGDGNALGWSGLQWGENDHGREWFYHLDCDECQTPARPDAVYDTRTHRLVDRERGPT